MIKDLKRVVAGLPSMLEDGAPWESLGVRYEKPAVERLWRQVGDLRVSLHRIQPCEAGEAFFHPHPWPSAMLVVSGGYETGVGYGAGVEPPPVAQTFWLPPGTCYEMVDRDAWHYVRPLGGTSLSVMVSGVPWNREMPKVPGEPPQPLSESARYMMLDAFRAQFRGGLRSALLHV